MVTFVSPVAGATQNPATEVSKPAELSDFAKNTLGSLGDMQAQFTEVMQRAEGQQVAALDPSGTGSMEQSLNRTAEMMSITSQVQVQLLQFSMATSISSNMGRNLNTFLKGQ